MRITVTTQPEPLVSLDEAKLALGFQGTSDRDELITGLILAAQSELDGPKGWVGISVAQQAVEVAFAAFTDTMCLPAGPVIAPATITYLDDDGAEQTLSDTIYTLLGDRIVRTPNESWPSTYSRDEAVTVAYDVGIEDENDPRIALMKTAIIQHVRMTMDHEDTDKRRETINWLVSQLRPGRALV